MVNLHSEKLALILLIAFFQIDFIPPQCKVFCITFAVLLRPHTFHTIALVLQESVVSFTLSLVANSWSQFMFDVWDVEIVGSVGEWFAASFLRRPWSQRRWFNSNPSLVVASLNKTLHDHYLCLVESNKQQIEKVRSKILAENLETRATPKRVWIRPLHSASVAFSWQEDKNEEEEEISNFLVGNRLSREHNRSITEVWLYLLLSAVT